MKFTMLFSLAILVVYIVQTKYMVKLSVVDNSEMLEAIANYERVIAIQSAYAERIGKIHESIKEMDFDIHQVQKQDEIKQKILQVRSVYKEMNMSANYFFGIQSSNILQIYFDTREEHSSLVKNKRIILDNLNNCKANL